MAAPDIEYVELYSSDMSSTVDYLCRPSGLAGWRNARETAAWGHRLGIQVMDRRSV